MRTVVRLPILCAAISASFFSGNADAGVHYRFSIDAGRKTGIDIGKVAAQRYFTPLPK